MWLPKIPESNSVLHVEVGICHGAIERERGENLQSNTSPDGIANGEKSIPTPHINKLSNLISESNLLKCIPIEVA